MVFLMNFLFLATKSVSQFSSMRAATSCWTRRPSRPWLVFLPWKKIIFTATLQENVFLVLVFLPWKRWFSVLASRPILQRPRIQAEVRIWQISQAVKCLIKIKRRNLVKTTKKYFFVVLEAARRPRDLEIANYNFLRRRPNNEFLSQF